MKSDFSFYLCFTILILLGLSCRSESDLSENSKSHNLITPENQKIFYRKPVAMYLPNYLIKFSDVQDEMIDNNIELYEYYESQLTNFENQMNDINAFTNKNDLSTLILIFGNPGILINKATLNEIKLQFENNFKLEKESSAKFKLLSNYTQKRGTKRMLHVSYLIEGEQDIYFSINCIHTNVGSFQTYIYSKNDDKLEEYIWSIGEKKK